MPGSRTSVFDRVQVDYLVRGATRVEWTLRERFEDPGPYYFQLQVSRNGGVDDEWENVGVPVTTFYAVDSEERLHGQDRRLVYRVRLETTVNDYNSPLVPILGKLKKRQWLLARDIVRQWRLEAKGLESFAGQLLRRRIKGTRCTACVDPSTGGITNSDCETCEGSGWLDGYWPATGCTLVDATPLKTRSTNVPGTGTTNPDQVRMGTFAGFPIPEPRDVWVDTDADRRYFIDNVTHISEMNQVPLIVAAELRLAEDSDRIYHVSLD